MIYTVTFKDSDGKVIDTQTIVAGNAATAPTAPSKEGYTFEHWDTDFSKVNSDLTVTAVYTKKQEEETTYTITYILNGGTNHPSNPASYSKGETVTLSEPTLAGKKFEGWFDSNGKQITHVTDKNITVTAKWLDVVDSERQEGELWIEPIPDQSYTGEKIKPQIRVYNGQNLLREKKDYTVSYQNNIAANDVSSASNAPTVIVKGMGNYTGSEIATFTILPKDISAEDIDAADIFLAASNASQKPVPVVEWNGRSLQNDIDFTLKYPSNTNVYHSSGEYKIRIIGKGNYTGERIVSVQITSATLLSSATVSNISDQKYTGTEICPPVTVRFGNELLKKGQDYIITYHNNIKPGTATAILTGIGIYSGEKKITYKITGISINQVTVNNLPKSVDYSSQLKYNLPYRLEIFQNNHKVSLSEGKDFKVSYKNNTKAGTATIIFTGINGYTGTLKKNFKITPYDIALDSNRVIRVAHDLSVPYAKDGAKANPVITCDGITLIKGKDYTLTYQNNKKISNGVILSTSLYTFPSRNL